MSTHHDLANVQAAAAHIVHIKGPTIALGDGGYFDFLDPASGEMTIEDYAYALAYTCRFRGQTRWRGERAFYGVAQHCTIMAGHLRADGYDAINQFAALMHESDEVPFGDMPGPAKPLLGDYKSIAKNCGRAIDHRFDVAMPNPALIKRYDIRMLATEKRDLMARHGDREWHNATDMGDVSLSGYEPFADEIVPDANLNDSAERFLRLYRKLRSELAVF